MADYAVSELGGRTPLEVAHTPNMDRIAACGIGSVRTIPEGMEPGSDVANLSLLGYDPLTYHTGRAPLEAASMGVNLKSAELAFRMNLVTLLRKSDHEIIMKSHSAGDISTNEAGRIVDSLKKKLVVPGIKIYTGIAYRHLLVWAHGPGEARAIPPHDILDQNTAQYLNQREQNPIVDLIRRSWEMIEAHPVNRERRKLGLQEANSIWLWGQGRAPRLPLFFDRFGLRGGVISAVDLLKGIGIYAGLEPLYVKGATGYLDTNYIGKAEKALEDLARLDFVFVHVEAPDEASHNGNCKEKIQAIEDFDEKVVGTVLKGLMRFDNFCILVASDHFTPIVKRTHTSEPAPFAWADKKGLESMREGPRFTEEAAFKSRLIFNKGYELMSSFVSSGLVAN